MKALVLVSGGIDSTVTLWWARAQGLDVAPMTFHYTGRPRGEIRATREIVALAGLPLHEATLSFVEEGADADARHGTTIFEGAPVGYIPARNALFYAAATHQAQALGCCRILGGHNADDAARFPDASESFFRDLEALLHRGLWRGPRAHAPTLEMPLIRLTRRGVLELGAELGAPLVRAWSCYEDGEAPCGSCPACTQGGGSSATA